MQIHIFLRIRFCFLLFFNHIFSLEQTIRRLQDELDNTTQLLESIRSKGILTFNKQLNLSSRNSQSCIILFSIIKGADLAQLTNFLDGTLSHIRSSESAAAPTPTTVIIDLK